MDLPQPDTPAADDPSAAFLSDWGTLLDLDFADLPWDADAQGLAASPNHPSPPPTASPADGGRVRKRDPRLLCQNYLAGRVPCACPEMDEKEAEEVGLKRARLAAGGRCQVPGCEADISKLKGYHRRHRVCLSCANAGSVLIDREHKRYCQQCGKFHFLENFDEDKRSCRRKLERHNNRRRRKSTDTKAAVEKETSCEDTVCENDVTKDTLNGVSSADNSRCLSNQALEADPILESEELLGSPYSSVPICCQNAQCQCVTSHALSNEGQLKDGKLGSVSTPTMCNKRTTTYSSACPTGRISFKLYDWNPAEFPRRLRHQIFQWLTSMPVELEGYIRPGCTILTVFLAMPQQMWEELSEDGISYLQAIVHTPESLLFGHGAMVVHLNNRIFQVLSDGTSLTSVKMEVRVPNLHHVHPICFEAGKPMELNICGSNLLQQNLRFLVSFSGKYLTPTTYEAIPQKKIGGCCKFSADCCGCCNCDDHDILRLMVPLTEPELFGPAFVEVENESGLSNFLPVLIGDERLCSEMKIIQQHFDESLCAEYQYMDGIQEIDSCNFLHLRQTKMFQLLLDIGWLVKKELFDEDIARDVSSQVRRFNCLLGLLIQFKSVTVLERIMQKLVVFMDGRSQHSAASIDDNEWKKLQESLCEARVILAEKHKHRNDTEECPTFLEDEPLHGSTEKCNQYANLMGVSDHEICLDTLPSRLIKPLIDKKQSVSFDVSAHAMHGCTWQQERHDILLLRKKNITRGFMLTALIVIICSAVCIVLLHPNTTRKVAVRVVQRYLGT